MALLGQLTVGILGDLSGYSSSLTAAQKETIKFSKGIENMGKNISAIGSAMYDTGKTLTKTITAPVVALGTALAGLTLAKGFQRLTAIDTAKAKLEALGHSAKNVDVIMDSALASVKGTAFGLGDAATAAASAVAAGIKPGKELTQYLTNVGDAAAIAGVEFSDMGSIFNKVQTGGKATRMELNQLADRGLPIFQWLADAAGVTDGAIQDMVTNGEINSELFNKAIQNNIGGAAQIMGQKSFTAAFANVGAAVGRIGASFLDGQGKGEGFFSQLKPLMADFTEKIDGMGDIAQKAGVKFGEMFLGLINKIKDVKRWFDDLDPGIQGLIKKIALFGSIGAVSIGPILMVFGKLIMIIGNLVTRFGVIMGAVTKLGGVMGILTGPIGIVIGIIASLIAIGVLLYKNWDTVKEKAQVVFTSFAPLLETVKGAFQNLIDSLSPIWESLKTLLSSLMPILTALGVVIGGTVVLALGLLISTFNAVVAAIGPFVNAIINLVDMIINVFNALVAFLNGDMTEALDFWKQATQSSIEFVKSLWDGVVAFFATFVKTIIDFFHGLYMTLVGNSIIPDMVNAIIDWFKKLWDTVVQFVKGLVDGVVKFFTNLWNNSMTIFNALKAFFTTVWDAIKSVFNSVVTAIANLVKTSFENMKSNINTVFNLIKSIISAAWDYVKNTFNNVLAFLKGLVTGDFGAMRNAINSQMENIRQLISAIWNAIKSFFATVLGNIISTVQSKFQEMINAVRDRMNNVKSTIETIWNQAKSFLSGINLYQIGVDIIKGLINGIGSMASAVWNKAKEIADGVGKSIKNALGIASPSKVTTKLGEETGQGLANGIASKLSTVSKTATSLANVIKKITESSNKEIKTLTTKANAEIKQIESKSSAEVKQIAKRSQEDINLIHAKAKKAKRKLTQAEVIRIRRIEEDAAKKIKNIETKSASDVSKINANLASDIKKIRENHQKEINEINKKEFDNAKNWIDKKKQMNELSLAEELAAWESVQGRFKKGSKEREEAEQQVYRVKKEIHDKLISLNDEYLKKVEDINQKLIDEEQKLNDEYNKAFSDRVKAITSFAGLFDEFVVKMEQSGHDLLNNLQSQVDGLTEWREVLDSLWGKIDDQALMEELEALGPKALGELKALNQLSATELDRYAELYRQKTAIAVDQATLELEGMKEDTARKIDELHKNSEVQLENLRIEWENKIKQIRTGTTDEFDVMNSSLKQIGENSIKGMINGLASMEGALLAKAKSIADAVAETMRSALQIKSPSRVMMSIGSFVGEGLVDGMKGMLPYISDVAAQMADLAVPSMHKVDLPSFATSTGENGFMGFGGISQHITVISPDPTSPSENARQIKQAARQLAMEWGR